MLPVDERDHVLEIQTTGLRRRRQFLTFDDLALMVDLVDLALRLLAIARVDLEALHHHPAARAYLEDRKSVV